MKPNLPSHWQPSTTQVGHAACSVWREGTPSGAFKSVSLHAAQTGGSRVDVPRQCLSAMLAPRAHLCDYITQVTATGSPAARRAGSSVRRNLNSKTGQHICFDVFSGACSVSKAFGLALGSLSPRTPLVTFGGSARFPWPLGPLTHTCTAT